MSATLDRQAYAPATFARSRPSIQMSGFAMKRSANRPDRELISISELGIGFSPPLDESCHSRIPRQRRLTLEGLGHLSSERLRHACLFRLLSSIVMRLFDGVIHRGDV